jgi:hypothetical protein
MKKLKIQIKSVFGQILIEGEYDSIADAINKNRSADLRYANLRGANLTGANLRYADLRYADLTGANLRYADLTGANLRYADLRYADLRYANLTSADLTSADLDFSVWPLWCKSLSAKIDNKLAAQLLFHAFAVSKDMIPPTKAQTAFMAKHFHRFAECGGAETITAKKKANQ